MLAPGAGAIGATIATAAPIAAEVVVTGVQIAMGDKIDWTQKVLSIAINVFLDRFGGAATGKLIFLLVQPANAVAFDAVLDIALTSGLTTSLTGFASPNFSMTYR